VEVEVAAPPAPPPELEEPPEPEPPLPLEEDIAEETVVLPMVVVKVEDPEVMVLTTAAVETALELPEPPDPPEPPEAEPKIVEVPRVEVIVVEPLVMAVTAKKVLTGVAFASDE